MYLSGADSPTQREAVHYGISLVYYPRSGAARIITHHQLWAANNGGIAQGDKFTMYCWLTWMASLTSYKDTCLSVEVLADTFATLARLLPITPCIRDREFHIILTAQDGLDDLQSPWDAFGVLLIGISTTWPSKLVACLVAKAKNYSKGRHLRHINDLPYMCAAQFICCDSTK